MIEAVFENSFFYICDKPSGVLSTPSRFAKQDARSCLGTELQLQLGFQIFPVHRLDFEVSGLVIYAKTPEAHRAANSWFENKEVHKHYQAVTGEQNFSHIPSDLLKKSDKLVLKEGARWIWQSQQLRGKKRAYESSAGKKCITQACVASLLPGGKVLWQLEPITGRPHQLRFDLSRHGFPIVGDHLYGSKSVWAKDSIALRAWKIDFRQCPQASDLGLPPLIEVAGLQDTLMS